MMIVSELMKYIFEWHISNLNLLSGPNRNLKGETKEFWWYQPSSMPNGLTLIDSPTSPWDRGDKSF
jgi:hypothetical protein